METLVPCAETMHQRRYDIWQNKNVLRLIYQEWFKWMAEMRSKIAGVTLEIGGGSGGLKSSFPDIYSSDVSFCPRLDLCLNAEQVPFKNDSLSNIVGFDIIHHMHNPLALFSEAERCLKRGGRLILIEPYLTPFSRIGWCLHSEPIDFKVDIFKKNDNGNPPAKFICESNQAVPTILFKKEFKRFLESFPRLKIITRKPFSYLAYPLSGGFEGKQLLPSRVYPFLAKVEKHLDFLAEWCACRIFVALEHL